VNRAIASDRLGIGNRGILHRLDISVFDVQPAFILFKNGGNDLGELSRTGQPPFEAICDAYDRVISAIRDGAPDVPLLIINEMPMTGRFAGVNELIPEFNTHVKRVAARYGCGHLDFHREIVDSTGALRDDLTYDGLHLNDAGYTLFAAHLQPHLPNPAG
jgi:lysophospholipase L1-like esterase